jgi:hypothetical protein
MRFLLGPRNLAFNSTLPTSVPGIHFTARGRVRYRGMASSTSARRVTRAIALAEVYGIAADVTSTHLPDEAFEAEQRIALEVSEWRSVKADPRVKIKARVALALIGDDAGRVAAYNDAQRAMKLNLVLRDLRLTHLRSNVLSDPVTAKLWWLEQHPTVDHGSDFWKEFADHILPLVSCSDNADPTERFVQVMTMALRRLEEKPEQKEVLVQLATVLFDKIGWTDLATEVSALSSTTADDRSESV